MRTLSGFSCFAIDLQLKCLLCVFLGDFPVSALSLIFVKCFSRFNVLLFLHIARQSQFNSARSRCRPSHFFSKRRDLSSSSVTVISLVSSLLCASCCFLEQRRHHIPISTVCQRLCSRSLQGIVWLPATAGSHRFSSCISFSAHSERTASTALWSVLNLSESSTCTRLASSFSRRHDEVHLC